MQFRRIVISFVLMFVYSFGFAHNMVPHCEAYGIKHQVAAQEDDCHHHHEHHQHTSDGDTDHEHIIHNDHFDEGLYDFFVCLLSNTEHPTSECNLKHYLFDKTNNKFDTKLAKIRLVSMFFAINGIVNQNKPLPNHCSKPTAIYLSPPIEESLYRGPPTFSC